MPSYNRAREILGLPTYNSWAELTPDTEIQAILADLYPDGINMLDPYVGGLLESASAPFPLFPALHSVSTEPSTQRAPVWAFAIAGHVVGASVGELFHTVILDQVRLGNTLAFQNVAIHPTIRSIYTVRAAARRRSVLVRAQGHVHPGRACSRPQHRTPLLCTPHPPPLSASADPTASVALIRRSWTSSRAT